MAHERRDGTQPKVPGQRPEPLVAHTLEGRVVFANDAFCAQHGVSHDEVTQMAPWAWARDGSPGRHAEILREVIEHGYYSFDTPTPDEYDEYDEDVRRWRIESWLVHVSGEPVVVTAQRDVSQLYQATQSLDLRSLLLDEVSDAVVCHSLDGRIVYVNNAACVERGYTREEFLKMRLEDFVTEDSLEANNDVMRRLISDGVAAFEAQDVTADGRRFTVEVHARLVDFGGEPIVVSVSRDISERRRAEQAVERLAFSDTLTGLPNRRALTERLEAALARAAEVGDVVAVAFIDLDHLKRINDRYGHAVGDKVLELTAMRLSGCVRKGDTVSRFGGDEFVVLCVGLDCVEAAERIAEKLLAVLREPFDLDGVSLISTASIGMAVNDPATIDAVGVLANADTAMYAVKDETRDSYAMYTPTMRISAESADSPHIDVRDAEDR